MQIQKFENEIDWQLARSGRITGTRLGGLVVKRGTGKKIAFYELISERLGIPADDESAMLRGKRLEAEALQAFTEATGKEVDGSLMLWSRDDDESIAISPDGMIGDTEAVECKCLSSARHIEALLTQKIPSDYEYQVLQYFCVNDQLQTLYFCFYDPRILAKPFFFIEVKREDVQSEVDQYLAYQREVLEEVNKIVLELSNF
jgi:predicted phage-related endonuclease